MFTGIIQGIGTLVQARPAGGGRCFILEAAFDLTDPEEGESIAVNGVCLTARDIRGRRFTVDVSPETLSRSILGSLDRGSQVNLERALRLSDRLGGHLVSGHVDGLGVLERREPAGDFVLFTFGMEAGLSRYVVEKGSIAINGVSLTVNSCSRNHFGVAIIPHTLEVTTLHQLRVGERVNLEVDIIGKYVEKLLVGQGKNPVKSSISQAFLAEHGFI